MGVPPCEAEKMDVNTLNFIFLYLFKFYHTKDFEMKQMDAHLVLQKLWSAKRSTYPNARQQQRPMHRRSHLLPTCLPSPTSV